ncbi:Probable aldo-keto reductase 1 [Linum perenne]
MNPKMESNEQNINIPTVKLGSQGFEVSRLGLGCAGLSGLLNEPLSDEDGCSLLKNAFHRGVTFFDTSNAYGRNHHNEIMIGKALKELPREKVQLATKFGIIMTEDLQFKIKGSPEYVRECCEASLKCLGVDYIDLYYQHRVDTSVPIEETMEEMKKLVNEGKVKYIGLSEASPDTIKRAHAVHPITALQMEYSLWSRDIEEEIIPLCRYLYLDPIPTWYWDSGLSSWPWVLCWKSSSGEPSQWKSIGLGIKLPLFFFVQGGHPRFMGDSLEKNKALYTRVANLAIKHQCTASQLALSWVVHQGNDIVPIPGTSKLKNLDHNIESLLVNLTTRDVKEISDAVQIEQVNGSREVPAIAKFSWQFANTPPKKYV